MGKVIQASATRGVRFMDEVPEIKNKELLMKILQQLTEEVWELCKDQRTEVDPNAGVDELMLSKVQSGALMTVSAVYAVDVGATLDQFLEMARVHYIEAHKRAPKWG